VIAAPVMTLIAAPAHSLRPDPWSCEILATDTRMRAVLFPGDRKVTLDERPIPEPGPGEALIRTRVVAVDILDERLELARRPGAEPVINSGTEDPVAGASRSRSGMRSAVSSPPPGWASNP
jgi:hypothetical protein